MDNAPRAKGPAYRGARDDADGHCWFTPRRTSRMAPWNARKTASGKKVSRGPCGGSATAATATKAAEAMHSPIILVESIAGQRPDPDHIQTN